MPKWTLGVLVTVVLAAQGCATPTAYERAQYDRLVAQGNPPIETYSPVAAGALNVLPGIGDAYNGQWGAFVANFLLWPASVLWGIPEAAVTASNQNVRETVYFYTLGPGKERRMGEP